jgi:hypothetical protein
MKPVWVAIGITLLAGCDQVTASPALNDASAAVPSSWTVLSAGNKNLYAVSGLSDSSVWAVGDKGTILYYDGTTLAPQASGTTLPLRGVWAVPGTSTAYAVGDGGTILQLVGGAWQQVGANTTQQILNGVWADATRIVAVGSNGTVVLGTIGAAKTTFQVLTVTVPTASGPPLPATENLFGVTGTPMGVVTIVGALGLVLQLQPGSMSPSLVSIPYPINSTPLLAAATIAGPMGAYVVGQQGAVYQLANKTPIIGCPQSALRAATSTPAGIIWIAGWDGTMCEINNGIATSFPYSDARWFNGIYAASATSLWVVGASGTFLHGLPPADAGVVGGGAEGGAEAGPEAAAP